VICDGLNHPTGIFFDSNWLGGPGCKHPSVPRAIALADLIITKPRLEEDGVTMAFGGQGGCPCS
jgi:hypothetical protein